jgi:hypothetical protein
MATVQSDQRQEGYRKYPIDEHGKARIQYFSVGVLTAIAVAYAANDQVELCKLPPGRKRILEQESFIKCSAFGAARTIDIGHRAYSKRNPGIGSASQEAEDGDAFVDGLDVSAAITTPVKFNLPFLKFDIFSQEEVTIFMTILGGTMPVGATLEGYIKYIYE